MHETPSKVALPSACADVAQGGPLTVVQNGPEANAPVFPVTVATGVAREGPLLVGRGETFALKALNGPVPEAVEVEALPRPHEVPTPEAHGDPRGDSKGDDHPFEGMATEELPRPPEPNNPS